MSADRLIAVARVQGAFGVRGEVRLLAYGDDPLALVRYRTLVRQDGAPGLTLAGGRADGKGGVIARTAEALSKEDADALRGLELYAPRAAFAPPTDEDEFFLADLIGLEARAPDGEAVGRVVAVHNFGAGDLLEVAPEGDGDTDYVAFTRQTVPEVRVQEGWLTLVRPDEVD